jgi:hypothetical protein
VGARGQEVIRKDFQYRKHRITVLLHDSVTALRRSTETPDSFATYETMGKTRAGGIHGQIDLARGRLRLDYVAHEVFHAVWALAKHENGAVCAADEEKMAYALDDLILRVWKWLLKVAPAAESDA